jgi:hypothetical protein
LQELVEHFHTASAAGQELSSDEKRELEDLVDTEWQAAIDRATAILRQQDASKSSSYSPPSTCCESPLSLRRSAGRPSV